MKVVGIRDVISHSDVEVPTGSVFKSKQVKAHGVANYILTLSAKQISEV
jgi:hypothetical protein